MGAQMAKDVSRLPTCRQFDRSALTSARRGTARSLQQSARFFT